MLYYNSLIKNLTQYAKSFAKDEEEYLVWKEKIDDMKLFPEEERLLVMINPPDRVDFGLTLNDYATWVPIMRCEELFGPMWLSEEELDKLEITKQVLHDRDFFFTLLRSVYLWHTRSYPKLALAFLRRVSIYTKGTFILDNFGSPLFLNYWRIVLVLFADYFDQLPDNFQFFVFNNGAIASIIKMGVDAGLMTQKGVLFFSTLDNRENMARDLSVGLLANDGLLARKSDGKPGTISFWINDYRNFVNERKMELNKESALKYTTQGEKFYNCTIEEVLIVLAVIKIYLSLLNGDFVYSDVDLKKVDQISVEIIKKDVDSKFIKGENGDFEDITGVLNSLRDYSKMYNDPKIAELYYFDETQGKFVWKE